MIHNALNGKPLTVYGDGKHIRDWLYVTDHCQALSQVLEKGVVGEVYNIGGDNEKTNLEMVETLCELLDELAGNSVHVPHKSLIQFVADRPGHDRRYAIDAGKIKRELNWAPKETLTSGLQKDRSLVPQQPEMGRPGDVGRLPRRATGARHQGMN